MLGAFGFSIVFAPAILLMAVLADLTSGIRRWRLLRLTLFSGSIIAIETAGIAASAMIWLRSRSRAHERSPTSVRLHDQLQYWYNSTILGSAHALLGLEISVENLGAAETANAVVIGRHISHVDAVLPAVVFGRFGHGVRYVLASGLQWGPCLDIVGNRQRDVFVDRTPLDRSASLTPITALGTRIDSGLVAAIFPEGAFFTPTRKHRALSKVAKRLPAQLERAAALRHLLPPRPAGTFALLDGAPNADLVLMGHVGLENLSTIKDIIKAVPFRRPVMVRLWRIPRSEIPSDNALRIDWLFTQWALLDEWIDQNK